MAFEGLYSLLQVRLSKGDRVLKTGMKLKEIEDMGKTQRSRKKEI